MINRHKPNKIIGEKQRARLLGDVRKFQKHTRECNARALLTMLKQIHGRAYKANIRTAWETGNYASVGLDEYQTELQAIRNEFGPTWLERNSG